MIYGPTFYTDI